MSRNPQHSATLVGKHVHNSLHRVLYPNYIVYEQNVIIQNFVNGCHLADVKSNIFGKSKRYIKYIKYCIHKIIT